MGGLLSCHSDLKTCHSDLTHCNSELEQKKNPMLGTTNHKKMPDKPKSGGKRTPRIKKNRNRTKHRPNW